MKQIPIVGKSIIAGVFRGEENDTFSACNPVENLDIEPLFHEASEAVTAEAVEAAKEAFPAYSRIPGRERALFLERIAVELENCSELLISRCRLETGLPAGRLEGELGRTTGQIRMFADLVREGSWVDARIDTGGADIRSMLVPIGPVAVFGASNFPLAFSTAGGDTISALASGCPVIFKSHPSHPGTCEIAAVALSRAVEQSGLPGGVFSLLQGRAAELSIDLVRRPGIKAVGFTGSHRAGRALFDAAAAREEPIPVFAEMGSINPVIILPNALKRRGPEIAKGLAGAVSLGVGQFCTNPGLVFVTDKTSLSKFKAALIDALSAIPAGIMLNKAVRDSYYSSIEAVSDLEGVTVEWVNSRSESTEDNTGYGCAITASPEAFLSHPQLRSEIFGPATVIVPIEGDKELVSALEHAGGQLTASFHCDGDDLDRYESVVKTAEHIAGRLIFNGFPTGVEVCSAMHHGGPFPASTDVRATSVGLRAIGRFARPLCYQNAPSIVLPEELQNDNSPGISRIVNSRREVK